VKSISVFRDNIFMI